MGVMRQYNSNNNKRESRGRKIENCWPIRIKPKPSQKVVLLLFFVLKEKQVNLAKGPLVLPELSSIEKRRLTLGRKRSFTELCKVLTTKLMLYAIFFPC
jgi:hypothetical protein